MNICIYKYNFLIFKNQLNINKVALHQFNQSKICSFFSFNCHNPVLLNFAFFFSYSIRRPPPNSASESYSIPFVFHIRLCTHSYAQISSLQQQKQSKINIEKYVTTHRSTATAAFFPLMNSFQLRGDVGDVVDAVFRDREKLRYFLPETWKPVVQISSPFFSTLCRRLSPFPLPLYS